jgi:hypothetical protein
MHEREREGGGVSRRVGGWIQGKMTKEKGRIGKKIMSVVVVVCGIWFTFHFFSFFFFFFPNLVVQVQAIRRLIHLFVVIISPLRFANYLLPTTTQSLSLSLSLSLSISIDIYIYISHHEIQVDGKGEGSWVEVAVKWSERGKDVHLCNLCVYFTYFFTVSDHLSTGPTLGSLGC